MSVGGVAPASAEVERVGERALLVRFRDADLAFAVARARALGDRLRAPAGDLAAAAQAPEIVYGAGSLLLRFDDGIARPAIDSVAETVRRLLEEDSEVAPGPDAPADREHLFEVELGGAAGPDLNEVAEAAGQAPDAVVRSFCAARYTVAFVGFSPGFPYLIGLPPELELPRRPSPRARVPAGSVAIAGPFAGVYPSATPGGWHLVGRTEATLFDPAADPPARLAPGDRVRFTPRRP